MYDLIIIGAGPAGLAATVYAARKRLDTLLLSLDIGGQINNTLGVENYLGYQFIEGPELIAKFQAQVSQFPVEQKIGYRVSSLEKTDDVFEAVCENGDRYQSQAVLFAAGKRPRKLEVPGEAELTGRGVTYCAICDGPVFSGQRVAVVGGGNSALGAALDMVKIAEHVDLVSRSALSGDAVLVDKLSHAGNLTVLTGYQPQKIEGEDFVSGLLIRDPKSGEDKRLEVSGVFIEIGMEPNSEPVKHLLELNQRGEVPVSCSGQTALAGFFAAGDVTDVPEKQILVAAGEGAKAALQAQRYLQRLEAKR